MSRYKQGYFKPQNPSKYKGDPTKIVYRSGWELKFMMYLDKHQDVIFWQSEEIAMLVLGGEQLADTINNALPYAEQYASRYQGTYIFPDDLLDNKDFYMTLRFVQYQKRSISQSKPIQQNNNSVSLKDVGTIRIPLPQNLRDQSTVHYNSQALGAGLGAGLDSIVNNGGISGMVSNVLSALKSGNPSDSIIDNIETKTAGLQQALGGTLGSFVAGSAGDAAAGLFSSSVSAVSAYSGLALNPFLTTTFDSPTFKEHNFEWLFTPKNPNETESLRAIIQTMKYHQLPGVGQNTGNVLFNYPSMVLMSIHPDAYMYQFKPAVIRSLSIDYAPSNVPAFFKNNNAPVAVRVNMNLQEIEMWTKNDFLSPPYSGSALHDKG